MNYNKQAINTCGYTIDIKFIADMPALGVQ